jgi:hypothetical protein
MGMSITQQEGLRIVDWERMSMGSSVVWRLISAVSVATSVAVTLLLMAISAGVEREVNSRLSVSQLQQASGIDVDRINKILHALTIFVAGSMIVQTSMTTGVISFMLMNARQYEIGVRRQGGVDQRKLVGEFTIGMVIPVLSGAAVGEAVGWRVSQVIPDHTPLPVDLNDWAKWTAFPTTVVMAMSVVIFLAYRFSGQSIRDLGVDRD